MPNPDIRQILRNLAEELDDWHVKADLNEPDDRTPDSILKRHQAKAKAELLSAIIDNLPSSTEPHVIEAIKELFK